MSTVFKAASALSLALTTVAALSVTDASFAFEASDEVPEADIVIDPSLLETSDEAVDQRVVFADFVEVSSEIPQDVIEADRLANEKRAEEAAAAEQDADFNNSDASSLQELVSQQSIDGPLSDEMQCLAGTVYFESKGETLAGQLAVARVVMARAESSRFPDSICGVVYQRSQFSFVRGGKMPRINTGHRHWRNAVAIAKIAMNDAWDSKVEGALFFHARYVSPGWRLQRIATIDNHIFYR
ncbi:cell wall hydrolase [Parasphingorhabdus halotolerans]|uniref:Cell wall hydrolase n=1 Tax=Parasphingorhabdus halotolerans TaxID=2725558 RepID=A0A6H2DLW7_9SPHN|nr:cell wall hydrolase [Parasphingorhabdus halotolerans]QJB69659.1 cell wall hydrolase [Parasphingorhabdus halotolerans]